jgi:hypothetical protein
MIHEVQLTPVVGMILGEDQISETRHIFRNVPIMSMRTSRGTSTGTLIKAGSKKRKTAGQRPPVRQRNLIATKNLGSKAILRRKSVVRASNAVVAAEVGPDVELAGREPAAKSGIGENRNG